MFNDTPRPLYPCIRVWMGPRAGVEGRRKLLVYRYVIIGKCTDISNIQYQHCQLPKHSSMPLVPVNFTCSKLLKKFIVPKEIGLLGVEGSSAISRLNDEANKRKGTEWKKNRPVVREIDTCKVDSFYSLTDTSVFVLWCELPLSFRQSLCKPSGRTGFLI